MNQLTFSDRTWGRALGGTFLFAIGLFCLGLAGWLIKIMGLNIEGVIGAAIMGALGAVLVYGGFKWLFHQKKLKVYFSKNQWKYGEGGPWFGHRQEGHLQDLEKVEIYKTLLITKLYPSRGDYNQMNPITIAKITYFYIAIRTLTNQLLFVAFQRNEESSRRLAKTLADRIQIPLQDHTANSIETDDDFNLDKFMKQPLP